MRGKGLLVFLFAILHFAYSCAPKLRSSITNAQRPLHNSERILVLGVESPFKSNGIQIGTLKVSDNGFSKNCSYEEVLTIIREVALENGANIIKMVDHKRPNFESTCHRITANLYRVPDSRKHEYEIVWSPNRKLTWDDFKAQPNDTLVAEVGAKSYLNFGFESSKATAFLNANTYVKTTFNCSLSWVREDQKQNEELLKHEQYHFNLSEIYGRKLKTFLNEAELNPFKFKEEARKVYNLIYNQYLDRQTNYDLETNHGLAKKQQEEWQQVIDNELNQ